jgi:hypothetical protein
MMMETPMHRRTPQQDLADLRALNARFIHNFVTNDVPSHSAITHPRFLCISPKGQRQNRDDYLRDWAHGFDPEVIIYWDVRDEDIALFGDVALVRSTNKWVRVTAYTDTYLHEGDRWLCIQAQLTAVAMENWPGDETILNTWLRGVLQPRMQPRLHA